METIEINPENIQSAAAAIPADSPVFMLNLLRYRIDADYRGRSGEAPCSGRDAYHERYRAAFASIAAGSGHKLEWYGQALAPLVGPADERWDEVAIVQYPSFAVYRSLVESPRYMAEANHHRLAALQDWRQIAIAKKS